MTCFDGNLYLVGRVGGAVGESLVLLKKKSVVKTVYLYTIVSNEANVFGIRFKGSFLCVVCNIYPNGLTSEKLPLTVPQSGHSLSRFQDLGPSAVQSGVGYTAFSALLLELVPTCVVHGGICTMIEAES